MWIADVQYPRNRGAGNERPGDRGRCAAFGDDVECRKTFDAKEFHVGEVEYQASAVGAVSEYIACETVNVRRVHLADRTDADHRIAVPFGAQKQPAACAFGNGSGWT